MINRKTKKIVLLEFKRTSDCGESYDQDMWRVADKHHVPILTGLRALTGERGWEIEVVPLVAGQRSVREKECLEAHRICRFSLSGCASRHSRRSPSSGRLELGARSRERVFAAYFGGGEPVFFLFYTGRTKLLIFTGILHFSMAYFMSASTKRSSRAATCLCHAFCRRNI